MNCFITMIIALTSSVFAYAVDYNEYIFLNNSKQCSNYFSYVEEKHSIPQNLLRSISVVETGRWHKDTNLYFTWPWTVNQAGKSYYFSTKSEAIKAVKQMLESGLTNVDIGCMQINLHHHPEAFLNLEQAFDPKTNIEYAAQFLKKNYQLSNNWSQAIAYYHSQNSIGKLYADKVIKIHTDYNNNKLYYDFCTSATGETTSCNSIFNYTKENLPFFLSNDNKEVTLSSNIKPQKNLKRRRSNMIPYSINN